MPKEGVSKPAPGLRSKLVLSRNPGTKRDPLEKCLLALLDACVGWAEDTISERRIATSALLKECRAGFGLEDEVSVGTVHNHLHALANLCGVEALFEVGPKRQSSTLTPEAKDKLRQLRPTLLQAVQELDPGQKAKALNVS